MIPTGAENVPIQMTEENKLKTAGSVMPDIVEELPPRPIEVRRTARVIADVIGSTAWASGKSPRGLAATSFYLAELIHEEEGQLSQERIDDHVGVSYGTIRKYYRVLPEVFVQNAEESDVARFGNPSFVMDRLSTFIRAEQHPDDSIGVFNYQRLEHID